jgi:hypothetical protein
MCGGVFDLQLYVICPNSKYWFFIYLLDLPEITRYLLLSMTLGKIHSGFNVFSTDHSSTVSHFPFVFGSSVSVLYVFHRSETIILQLHFHLGMM